MFGRFEVLEKAELAEKAGDAAEKPTWYQN